MKHTSPTGLTAARPRSHRPAGRLLAIAALLAGACSGGAWGQATGRAALPSPLRVGKAPQMFQGAALRLDLDGPRLDALRGKGSVRLSEFMLAPGALGEEPRAVTLNLRAMNVFDRQTRFVLGDPTGQGREIDLPLPEVMIFEGSVEGEVDSEVFLAFSEHGTYGFVNLANTQQIISSGPTPVEGEAANDALIYDPRRLPEGAIHWRDFVCGTAAPEGAPPANEGGIAGNPTCSNVWLAIETDFEFTNGLFGGNVNAAANYVTVMTAAASNRLTLNINSRLRLRYVRLWNNPADPWNAPNTGDQLDQFRAVWEASMEGVQRHLAHFLSGRDLGGGVAWLATMCNPDWGYAVSANLDGFFPTPLVNNHPQNWDIYVYCHELGHNFGTTHTHNFCPPVDRCAAEEAWGECQNSTVCINTGTIMSYCHTCAGGLSNIVLSYHPVPSQAMLDHLATVPPALCSLECVPETLRVPQDYDDIQDAIDAAYDGDEVVLADGVYTGARNKNLTFNGKSITVRSASNNPMACVIDCQDNGRAFIFNHDETTAATVQGLSIQHAYPVGAVYVDSAGATFTNCMFIANRAGVDGGAAIKLNFGTADINDCSFLGNIVYDPGGLGGAISFENDSTLTLTNSVFQGNTASVAGAIHGFGGESSLSATGCSFSMNEAGSGAAIYSSAPLNIEGCTFDHNTNLNTAGPGGAIYLPSATLNVISNCAFFDNRAGTSSGSGGAIRTAGDCQLLALNCVFNGNRAGASGHGGAISVEGFSDVIAVNSLFSGNRAGTAATARGGAISLNTGTIRTVNCTFAGNLAGVVGGVSAVNGSAVITNCIVWGNATPQASHGGGPGSIAITYSDIQGGFAGVGNLNLDPMFIHAAGPDTIVGTSDDDLRIADNSPVIDVGTGIPLHFQRTAVQWLTLRPGAQTATFDEFYPGLVGDTGCRSGGSDPVTLDLAGGTMTVTALDSGGNQTCAIIDGSTPAAVSDAALSSAGARLRLEFEPPITAFYTFYGSLATGTTGSMRLFHEGEQVGLLTSLSSPHATNATGHGFSALTPIDEIEVTVTDSNSVMGAFNAVWPSETSLGTTNIPGYGGPQGANVLNDFGVVFGDADLLPDLDGNPRVADGDNDGDSIVDMGAYERRLIDCPANIATGAGSETVVNIDDLLAVISAWGACPGPPAACPANIVASGSSATSVDIDDLLAVISAWGPCP